MLDDYSYSVPIAKKIYLQIWRIINRFFFLNWCPPASFIRIFLARLFGAKIGKNCLIKPDVIIYDPSNIVFGNNVWIGENVDLYSLDQISIGCNVVVSQYCYLCTGSHSISRNFATVTRPIVIQDGVWICAKSTILGGANITSKTVVAAGSIKH